MKIVQSFHKMAENTMVKGEIALYKQFLLFYSVFKRLVLHTHKNQSLFGRGLRSLLRTLWDKEKMLVYPIKARNHHCSNTEYMYVVCKRFQFDDG